MVRTFLILTFAHLVFSLANAREAQPQCDNKAGFVPRALAPVGMPDKTNPIEHIIVVMQENRSFDGYFGKLNQPQYYGNGIDGVRDDMFNPDQNGEPVYVYHEKKLCGPDPGHEWPDMHAKWNKGANDGFVIKDGRYTMGYFDQTELFYYYELANTFATADRYFSSVLGPTYPNRFYLYTGTSFGHTGNSEPHHKDQFDQKTIFDLLEENGVTWKYYVNWYYLFGSKGYASIFKSFREYGDSRLGSVDDFHQDLKNGTLPQVVFVESDADEEDEHPRPQNIQEGQEWTSEIVGSLLESPLWEKSVLFFTYDEAGGFFDHVPPPLACAPDEIAPISRRHRNIGGFDRYGFRVPFLAISPYVKRHFVSHEVYDHTSILKFIETKFNLPALTARDANANGLMDLFDFKNPDFSVPKLPSGEADPARACKPPRRKK